MTIRVGLVDSGVSDHQKPHVVAGHRFVPDDYGGLHRVANVPDLLGHGTALYEIIRHHAPDARLYNAQVFDARGVTTAATVAAALDWLIEQKMDVINLSLGLHEDRDILRETCARAVSTGIILVAASPAQGNRVFPSAYPDIIRATGDARCETGQISYLDNAQADFGGCPRGIGEAAGDSVRAGGASMGTAHISGRIAGYLRASGEKESVIPWLISQANYIHREQRKS